MAKRTQIPSTAEKALQLNLEKSQYGVFAEIGAGQDTAGWFFRVGGASGTVAKSISAYDMQMSDAIYGQSPRYVSRERLLAMLEHEYTILEERLREKRGATTTFFAFANTVRARAYSDKEEAECHGWLGIRFQTHPGGAPHTILLHSRMFAFSNLEQQQHLGILGVNLVHAAMHYREDLETFVESLLDGLTARGMEIDMLKFDGPDFTGIDNRECALMLVEKGLSQAAFLDSVGQVVQVAEVLYKKPVLVLRGSFQPVTHVHLDMLQSAGQAFRRTAAAEATAEPLEIMEFSMNSYYASAGELTHADFLQRANVLQALGKNVLISKFNAFHRLGTYLSRFTSLPIGLVMSLDIFEKLFQEQFYEDLPGGILESFGRLFKNALRLYVYPVLERQSGELRVIQEAQVQPHLRCLFDYLLQNKRLVSLVGTANREAMQMWTTDVRRMMEEKDPQWENYVPAAVRGYYQG
jgi:hypothetical protein